MNVSDNSYMIWTLKNGHKRHIFEIVKKIKKNIELNRILKDGKTVLTLPLSNTQLLENDMICIIKYFLDLGVDPDLENQLGKTALLEAAGCSKKDVVDLLIRCQANVKKIDKAGNTICHHLVKGWMLTYVLAFAKNSEEKLMNMEEESTSLVVLLITEKGLEIERKNNFGESALSLALSSGLEHIAHVILQHTNGICVTEEGNNNLLHCFWIEDEFYLNNRYDKIKAEKWRNFHSRYASKIVEILLEKGVSALGLGNDRRTPLWMAVVREERLDIIDSLIHHSIWSNHQQLNHAVTTILIELFGACNSWGDESRTKYFLTVASILIAEGGDVNAMDRFGMTAVYYAFQGQNLHAADFLTAEDNADFGILYHGNRNLYHILAGSEKSSDEGLQKALFDLIASKACCDVNGKAFGTRTPLHCATECANIPIARKLIHHYADVNAKDPLRSTALHLAVNLLDGSRGEQLIELLVTHGADVNCKNFDGKRPLACVTLNTSRRSIELLLQWGALVNDYHNGQSVFSIVFMCKGFQCALEMLAYGLDINDHRIYQFLNSQRDRSELLADFMWKYWIKHDVAQLTYSDYYRNYLIDPVTKQEYEQRCVKEVDNLKRTPIDSKTSLYDYLHMDDDSRVLHNNNEKLKNLVDRPDLLEQQFSEYSVLILARYRTAVRWKSLLGPAKEAWLRLTHIALPEVCIEMIFAHLTNEDLVVFIDKCDIYM